MNIGFDLDKIFIDYPPFVPNALIDKLYKRKSNGILTYKIPSNPERALRTLSHFPLFRPPIIENIRYVKSLAKNKDHKYYLVSSRFSFLKERTQEIIQKYSFEKIFNTMFFNFNDQQPHIFKKQVLKKMNVDLYVDDDLPLLEYLASKNTKIRLFWLNSIQTRPLKKNIFAIKHLFEMFQ